MTNIKYLMIYLMEPDEIIDELENLSNTNIKRFFVGTTNAFVFTSNMNIDELHSYFTNEHGHIYFLTHLDSNLKIALPRKVVDFLESDEEDEIEKFRSIGILTDEDMEDMSEYIEKYEGSFDCALDQKTMKEMSPEDYISTLTNEEKEEHIETLLSKMPNLNEWEGLLLKELTK